jgi:hypothetical protein
MRLSLTTSTKTWFDIDSTQEATIRNIAIQEENTLAKVQAQNVLHLVYRDTFPDYIDEEEYYLRQQLPVINSTTSKKKNVLNQLTVIPNPANDFITIKLNRTEYKEYNVEVIDITGKLQYHAKIEFSKNEILLDVGFLNSGLYLVRVTDGVKINASSKLMIAR